MALEKMKKTPTGWGLGYKNIDFVRCERKSSTQLKCTLIPSKRKDEELTGTDVMFKKIRNISISPRAIIAYELGKGNFLACYVDTGLITCLPEKELKRN